MGGDLGLCLIGTGGIATAHMEALDRLAACERRWVMSRRPEAAAQFGSVWGFARHTTKLDDALADPDVDVVLVTSPNQVHAGQAAQALRAGKHVIVEIPAALTLKECEELAELSAETGRRLQVCHTMRSFPAIREVKERVSGGTFTVTQVSGFFSIPRRRNEGWKGERSWIDDLLWHHGCHQVDAALWVLGVDGAVDVTGHLGSRHPEFGMVRDVSISFVTARRQVVANSLTYNTGRMVWELRFIGDEDVLTFRNGGLYDEAGTAIVAEHSVRDLVTQNAAMLDSIGRGEPGDYDIDSVLAAMRVLAAAEAYAEAES